MNPQFPVLSFQFSVKPNRFLGCTSQRFDPGKNENILHGRRYGPSYRDLNAWQKAMEFVTQIYEATQKFPGEERYGLTNQLRRASVSLPSNIAEG